MKRLFPGYYAPSSDELDVLWDNAIFVVDTNVLLHLYRHSEHARENLLKTLKYLSQSGRLWIPYQVALEYQRNRYQTIEEQHSFRRSLLKQIDADIGGLIGFMKGFKGKHASIDVEQIIPIFMNALSEAKKKINEQAKLHPNWMQEDAIRDQLDAIFDKNVGEAYTPERAILISTEAETRFRALQPPGFRDHPKLGDLIIWFQMIDHALIEKKPFIFVTDDRKDDWWIKEPQEMPHPELVQEFITKTGERFHMYTSQTFLEEAEKRFELNLPRLTETLGEIQELLDSSSEDDLSTMDSKLNSPQRSKLSDGSADYSFQQIQAALDAITPKSSLQGVWDAIKQSELARQAALDAAYTRPFQQIQDTLDALTPKNTLQDMLDTIKQSELARQAALDAAYTRPFQQIQDTLDAIKQSELARQAAFDAALRRPLQEIEEFLRVTTSSPTKLASVDQTQVTSSPSGR